MYRIYRHVLRDHVANDWFEYVVYDTIDHELVHNLLVDIMLICGYAKYLSYDATMIYLRSGENKIIKRHTNGQMILFLGAPRHIVIGESTIQLHHGDVLYMEDVDFYLPNEYHIVNGSVIITVQLSHE